MAIRKAGRNFGRLSSYGGQISGKKIITVRGAVVLGIGSVVGAGIFALMSEGAGRPMGIGSVERAVLVRAYDSVAKRKAAASWMLRVGILALLMIGRINGSRFY